MFDFDDCIKHDSKEYNDTEFLFMFCLRHESFFKFVEMIQNDPIFHKRKFKKARPVEHQLLVFLYRIGREGVGASLNSLSTFFKIGKGSIRNYIKNCLKAILKLQHQTIYWPSQSERDEMKQRLMATGFRHCVGIIDGTLVCLDRRPAHHHECYYSRKSDYSINCTIVCDDLCRVTYFLAGWPGSVHDNRVFRNTDLFQNKAKYFSTNEYLLGDSAYSSNQIMVQAFKKTKGQADLPQRKERFNTFLAEVRITSEHCIGMIKGRFPSMRRLNVWIKDGKKQVKHIVELITSCIIIHNLMIDYDDKIPQEWYDEFNQQIRWDIYDDEYSSESDIDHNVDNDLEVERRREVFKHIQKFYM